MKKNTPETRIEIMQPNEQKSLAEKGQSPQAVRELAQNLLGEASFATALFEPSTAVSLSRVASDQKLWRFDEQVSRALFAQSAASKITVKRSLMAPVLRKIAQIRVKELTTSVESESRDATQIRQMTLKEWGITPLDWAEGEDWDESPLEIALSPTRDPSVILTPDQYRACGLIELVRASGKVLGQCDGDALANDFMHMILDAVEPDDGCEVEDRLLYERLAGGFLFRAESLEAKPKFKLSGRDQLLAVTILAAWLRMSHLGTKLSSLDRLAMWGDFFDGRRYGSVQALVGEAWSMNEADLKASLARMNLVGPDGDRVPWLEKPGGVPLIFAGIPAELLRIATQKCGILDQVSYDFTLPDENGDLPEPPSDASVRLNPQADRVLVQLKDRYNYLVSQPICCCWKLRINLEAFESRH